MNLCHLLIPYKQMLLPCRRRTSTYQIESNSFSLNKMVFYGNICSPIRILYVLDRIWNYLSTECKEAQTFRVLDALNISYTFFFIRKKFIRKWGSNRRNLKKIVRKSRGSNSKIKCFYKPKIDNFIVIAFKILKDGVHIQVYNSINESVNHFNQFISVQVKKNLRKSQAQFREKLRKLRLRQNNDFLIKKTCI